MDKFGFSCAHFRRSAIEFLASAGGYVIGKERRSDVIDISLDGVTVRKYTPFTRRKNELMRTIVYFHGGGWTVGSIGYIQLLYMLPAYRMFCFILCIHVRVLELLLSFDSYDEIADRLSHELNAIVFNVE